jgi:hypothetical protein
MSIHVRSEQGVDLSLIAASLQFGPFQYITINPCGLILELISLLDQVLAYTRWNDEGSRVVVVANLSGNFLKDYTIPHVPADGTWHEWSSDYDIEISGNTLV